MKFLFLTILVISVTALLAIFASRWGDKKNAEKSSEKEADQSKDT